MGTERGGFFGEGGIFSGLFSGGKRKTVETQPRSVAESPPPPRPELAPPPSLIKPRRFDEMPPPVPQPVSDVPPQLRVEVVSGSTEEDDAPEAIWNLEAEKFFESMNPLRVIRKQNTPEQQEDYGWKMFSVSIDKDGKDGWVNCSKRDVVSEQELLKGMRLNEFLALNFTGPGGENVEDFETGQVVLSGGAKVKLALLKKKE